VDPLPDNLLEPTMKLEPPKLPDDLYLTALNDEGIERSKKPSNDNSSNNIVAALNKDNS
jgi:hypothetical protein